VWALLGELDPDLSLLVGVVAVDMPSLETGRGQTPIGMEADRRPVAIVIFILQRKPTDDGRWVVKIRVEIGQRVALEL
jgi:hypothetical protein